MNGPSRHLTWTELACWNKLGRRFDRAQPGERVAPYPQPWRETRAILLGDLFEEIRALLGDHPIRIQSAYRPDAYNRAVGGATGSQHIQGNALDLWHPRLPPREMFAVLFDCARHDRLERLGGIGSYATFVHVDIRPRVRDRVATWTY